VNACAGLRTARRSTFGLFSAISKIVTKHGTIAALVFLAVFTAPFAASAQTCSMTMPVRAMDCSADCCAKMKSCVRPQENPVKPTATATAAQPPVVMIAPVLHEVVPPTFDAPLRASHFLLVQAPAHSPAPLALSCSLLI
jgi:hypothetical protein